MSIAIVYSCIFILRACPNILHLLNRISSVIGFSLVFHFFRIFDSQNILHTEFFSIVSYGMHSSYFLPPPLYPLFLDFVFFGPFMAQQSLYLSFFLLPFSCCYLSQHFAFLIACSVFTSLTLRLSSNRISLTISFILFFFSLLSDRKSASSAYIISSVVEFSLDLK